MATFSTNQVRQLYVALDQKSAPISTTDSEGTIAVKGDTNKTHVYFEYRGAGDNNLTRSDLINTENILYAVGTHSNKLKTKLKTVTVALNNINGGNPVAGQDYILRIAFRQYVGMSDEDQYFKYGMVHAYAGMGADEFYKILAQSIAKNFSREVTPLIKIEVHSAATKGTSSAKVVGFDENGYKEVLPNTNYSTDKDAANPYYNATTSAIINDIDSIRITEVEQPWRKGIMAQTPVYFEVQDTPITVSGDERLWATLTKGTNGGIGNGKNIADLEYFCMGERGDIYRGVGFPNNIDTKYLVDETKEYHTFDIHYAYVGNNESVQKSEKTITIVCSDLTKINAIITAFNTATNLSIASITA